MMSLGMLAGILQKVREDCRVVLVGDYNQLLSVGTGNVLPDLLRIGVPCIRLRIEKQLSVRELQVYFGFAEPAAIYHWQSRDNLPSLDNMVALSKLFGVAIEEIVVIKPSRDMGEKKLNPSDARRYKRHKPLLFLAAA